MQLQAGLYRHYKGQQYRVFGTAQHSETEEWLVVYQALDAIQVVGERYPAQLQQAAGR